MLTAIRQITTHCQTEFIRNLFVIALPIILQNMLFASKGLLDVVMLGQLSETDIAAVGLASKAMFVCTILLMGIATGGSILVAQFWGAKNNNAVRRSTALSLVFTLLSAALMAGGIMVFGEHIMALATDSLAIITAGADYLTIAACSLLFAAISTSFTGSLKSIKQAGTATLFSAIGIVCNLVLNWLLIFGHAGFPALGLKGAALATLLSFIIEALLLLIYIYGKKHPLHINTGCFKTALTPQNIQRFASLSIPTSFNFLLWSGGIFAYHAMMGSAGPQALTALSVISPIESFSLSFLVGIANACAILVGNQLGAKQYQSAYYQSLFLIGIAVAVTFVVSLFLLINRDLIIGQFAALEPTTQQMTENFYLILCMGIVLRSVPTTLVVGVLRAGGDVKFCLYQDLLTQWAFGIPLVAIATFGFGLAAEWIFALFFAETLFKWFASTHRFISRKWMQNLTDKS